MTVAIRVPLHVRACLVLCAAAALLFAPAAAQPRLAVPGVRARAEHAIANAARLPQRVDAAVHALRVAPARPGHGPSPFACSATAWSPCTPTRLVARDARAFGRRLPRARRLAFPTQATPPPRALA